VSACPSAHDFVNLLRKSVFFNMESHGLLKKQDCTWAFWGGPAIPFPFEVKDSKILKTYGNGYLQSVYIVIQDTMSEQGILIGPLNAHQLISHEFQHSSPQAPFAVSDCIFALV
jgi:hypothetical protein